MRVFVSSVMQGFEAERAAARDAIELLRHEAVMAEGFGAQPQSSQSACLDKVRSCDVYVGVFGRRYGYVAPSGMSVSEEEFEEARQRGLRILVFVSNEEKDPKQDDFLRKVGDYNSGYFYAKYTTAAELQNLVVRGLNDLGRAGGGKRSADEAARHIVSCSDAVQPEHHQSGLLVGLTPTQDLGELLGPQRLSDQSFHEEVTQLLLFGQKPRLFDATSGTRTEEGRDFVRFRQQSRGRRETFSSLTLYADGTCIVSGDLTLPDRGFEHSIMMGCIIDSNLVSQRLLAAINVASSCYQLIADRRLTTVYLSAEIRGINQKQFGPVPRTPPRSMSMPMRELGNAVRATDSPQEYSLPQLREGTTIASDFLDRWTRFFKAEGAYFAGAET